MSFTTLAFLIKDCHPDTFTYTSFTHFTQESVAKENFFSYFVIQRTQTQGQFQPTRVLWITNLIANQQICGDDKYINIKAKIPDWRPWKLKKKNNNSDLHRQRAVALSLAVRGSPSLLNPLLWQRPSSEDDGLQPIRALETVKCLSPFVTQLYSYATGKNNCRWTWWTAIEVRLVRPLQRVLPLGRPQWAADGFEGLDDVALWSVHSWNVSIPAPKDPQKLHVFNFKTTSISGGCRGSTTYNWSI